MSESTTDRLLQASRDAVARSRRALDQTIEADAELGNAMDRSAQTKTDHEEQDEARANVDTPEGEPR
jgi:hypothetical protein